MGTQRTWRQRLALAGGAEAVWFIGFSLLLGVLRPGYDPTHDAISRLGEQGSAAPIIWNLGGFGVSALLYALYSIAIRDAFGSGLFFVATALQAIAIGGGAIFSCDSGCPAMTVSTAGTLHTVFGLPYFAITCVAPFIAWRAFRGRADWTPMTPVTLILGFALVVLFLAGPVLFGAEWIGLWQRLVLVPALAWQAVVSIRLYRLSGTSRVAARQREQTAQG
jgi:hypothetical membrane protein